MNTSWRNQLNIKQLVHVMNNITVMQWHRLILYWLIAWVICHACMYNMYTYRNNYYIIANCILYTLKNKSYNVYIPSWSFLHTILQCMHGYGASTHLNCAWTPLIMKLKVAHLYIHKASPQRRRWLTGVRLRTNDGVKYGGIRLLRNTVRVRPRIRHMAWWAVPCFKPSATRGYSV